MNPAIKAIEQSFSLPIHPFWSLPLPSFGTSLVEHYFVHTGARALAENDRYDAVVWCVLKAFLDQYLGHQQSVVNRFRKQDCDWIAQFQKELAAHPFESFDFCVRRDEKVTLPYIHVEDLLAAFDALVPLSMKGILVPPTTDPVVARKKRLEWFDAWTAGGVREEIRKLIHIHNNHLDSNKTPPFSVTDILTLFRLPYALETPVWFNYGHCQTPIIECAHRGPAYRELLLGLAKFYGADGLITQCEDNGAYGDRMAIINAWRADPETAKELTCLYKIDMYKLCIDSDIHDLDLSK